MLSANGLYVWYNDTCMQCGVHSQIGTRISEHDEKTIKKYTIRKYVYEKCLIKTKCTHNYYIDLR